MVDHRLYPVRRQHLEVLAGPYGIWQHATGTTPNEAFGSCTDDVARLLLVDLLHRRELGWEAVRDDVWRCLRFLGEAFDPSIGRFRNFRARDGAWLEVMGSEDSQGRALLSLGVLIAEAPDGAATAQAGRVFVQALPGVRRATALRATASALLGCAAALDGGLRGGTLPALELMAARLRRAFTAVERDEDWPWPEPVLTYENALLPRAMLVASAHLGDDDLRRAGLRALDWLIRVQTAPDGSFSPIGSSGWWPRDGSRSRFDQQPIEAASMILAADVALRVTGNERYRRIAEAAYGWFLGDNDGAIPVADPASGGCHDGLTPGGVNLNQGAESTLMWLTALELVRRMRRDASGARMAGAAALPALAGACA